jgi:hypothetical protein
MKVFFGEPFSLLSFRQSLNGIQLVFIHIQEEKKVSLGVSTAETNQDREQDFSTRWDKVFKTSRSRVSIKILLKIETNEDFRALTLLRLVVTLFIDRLKLFWQLRHHFLKCQDQSRLRTRFLNTLRQGFENVKNESLDPGTVKTQYKWRLMSINLRKTCRDVVLWTVETFFTIERSFLNCQD